MIIIRPYIFINIILNAKKMPILLDGHLYSLDGIRPAISCVTGRRVNRFTLRDLKMVTPTGLEPVLPPWKGGVLTT